MDSDLKLLRRKVTQQINREMKDAKPKPASYKAGYIDALARVVHLIDKINLEKAGKKNDPADDYDQHRYSGLLTED